MITGVLLAIARITGETAPLLFTALNNQFFSWNLNAPMASLPVVIFQFALSPYEDWQQLAWAGRSPHHGRGARLEHRWRACLPPRRCPYELAIHTDVKSRPRCLAIPPRWKRRSPSAS